MTLPSNPKFLRLFPICMLAVALGGTPVHAQFSRQSVLPTSRELNRLGLEQAWWSLATLNANFDKLVYLSADEEAVIAQSRSGIVTLFDAETGERLWSRLVGTSGAHSYPVSTNSQQVVIATGMNMYALDKRTGKQLWKLNLIHHPSAAPGIDDTQVYVGTIDGTVYAYNLKSVQELYVDQRLPDWSDVALVWQYAAAGEVTSPPLPAGRTINFAGIDGSMYAISRREGVLTFQFETNGAIRTPIGQNADSLFIASDDFRFFCINRDNGRMKWSFVAGLPIRQQPQVVGDQVYIAPERGGLYSLSVDSGIVAWHQVRATSFLTATKTRVYAVDDLGNVLVIAREDGAVISTLPMRGMSVYVNNDRTDRVFLASESGVVIALKEADSQFPRYHKFPERQPILPLMGPDPNELTEPTEPEPAPTQ